ncbi:radial spoke head 1 homolog [Actinia tenebrosa]|uniref:Radial spoke head 1 homolog n=1 Tax=Actinia tenebrosa TaxID=6105 RepID=A0A6P8J4N7_ACTTE|nr:radial spoke head 1 homolog [Actinia tenebrosa]XP_031572958.1 radial spoke head 1 homolog [Actinia tenebrosa]
MGTNNSKGEPAKLRENEIDEGFEDVERYHGNSKDGRRHGLGVYYYDNGDIYDGEWRKGRKEGRGTYVFANGKKNVGWFYRDEYVGNEPNEKLKRKMRKKRMSYSDAEPLPNNVESSVQNPTCPTTHNTDSEDEDNNVPKLKDDTNLDIRRAQSMRRQQYFRAKYNIPDKKDPEEMIQDSRGLRDSVRAKWGLKRSKSCHDGSSKSQMKDPRLLTKQEEMLERRNSKRQREAIKARYNLH